MSNCSCVRDYENCEIHDWRKVTEVPSRKEEIREREIRREMRMTSSKKSKQEF